MSGPGGQKKRRPANGKSWGATFSIGFSSPLHWVISCSNSQVHSHLHKSSSVAIWAQRRHHLRCGSCLGSMSLVNAPTVHDWARWPTSMRACLGAMAPPTGVRTYKLADCSRHEHSQGGRAITASNTHANVGTRYVMVPRSLNALDQLCVYDVCLHV